MPRLTLFRLNLVNLRAYAGTVLRACEFGAVRTTRPHKDFPLALKELKERYAKKLL
jgi:hypothetical protein